ncbi:MAG: HAMP domain-containing sensor histidine kinase [Xanthobacteraceae bacterium]
MSERGLARLRHALIVACAGLVLWIAGALPASAVRRVVLLFDERPELPGLAALDEEFVRTIREKSSERIEIYREGMDRSRFDSDYQPLLRDFLRAKYASKTIDAVVAVFGPALDFLLDHGAEIFPGAHIVFCGTDRAELGDRTLPAHVRGVLLKREFAPTLELALALHPQTRHAIVVAGTSDFDTSVLEQVKKEFQPYTDRLAFTYATSLPLQKLLTDLKQLPPGSIVLVTTFFKDGGGEPFVPHEVVPLVSAAASRPLYGFLDQFLGRGIVGGKLYGTSAQGAGAAELVLRSLAGDVPDGVQLVELPANKVQFDWRQLQRWGIAESALPPESEIRFREPSAWAQYRLPILAVATAILLQSGLIGWLIYEHRRRSAAEVQSRNAMAELANMNRLATAGQLSASIAHEINQPVTGVVLKASAALRWLAAEKPDLDRIRSVLGDIAAAGQRAGDIINSVRAMFQNEQGAKAAIDLNRLINTVLLLLRVDLQRDGVRVETRLDEALPAVSADAVQLQQVILNLVVNAADAMRAVQTRVLTVQTSRIGGRVHVSVEDTGGGVSDADRERIFKALVTTKAGGMGMGLSICRSIIEAHGGRIWVEAVTGSGAIFQFELPAAEGGSARRDVAA